VWDEYRPAAIARAGLTRLHYGRLHMDELFSDTDYSALPLTDTLAALCVFGLRTDMFSLPTHHSGTDALHLYADASSRHRYQIYRRIIPASISTTSADASYRLRRSNSATRNPQFGSVLLHQFCTQRLPATFTTFFVFLVHPEASLCLSESLPFLRTWLVCFRAVRAVRYHRHCSVRLLLADEHARLREEGRVPAYPPTPRNSHKTCIRIHIERVHSEQPLSSTMT